MSRHRAPSRPHSRSGPSRLGLRAARLGFRLGLIRPRTRGSRGRVAVVAVAAVVVVLLGAGIAIAAWTSTGSGTASAKAGTALAPTTTEVDAAAFTSGLLYPGGTGDVKIIINNPNPYPVRVASIAQGGGPITVTGAAGECTEHGVTFSAPAKITSDNAIAAGSSLTMSLPAAVGMASGAENGCQGAVFGIPVTITVVSG